MKIKWYAHASFRLQSDGLRIITDPYSPVELGYAPITDPADIVIRSSADDLGHCFAEMISGSPLVITATELEPQGVTTGGITFTPIYAQESRIYKEIPKDNAMYRFELEGVRIAHLGDVGNALTVDQLDALANVDVMFAPTGGPPTIELDDLIRALDILKPRVFIPMHFRLPGAIPKMLPVSSFTERFPREMVEWRDQSEIEITAATLPTSRRVIVIKPSTVKQ